MKQLMTIYEVARALNVSMSTVRRWYAKGILPQPIRLGHSLRWQPETIEAFIQTETEKHEVEKDGTQAIEKPSAGEFLNSRGQPLSTSRSTS